MIDRETAVEQSVTNFVRAGLDGRGYKDSYKLVESFPHDLLKLTENLVAIGFSFDQDGTGAELGSSLMTRIYVIEFFAFGMTLTWARNLANVVKFAADRDGIIPLLDLSVTPPTEVDTLVVLGARALREPIPEPQPWQEFVYRTEVRVEDTYYASAT